MKCEVVLVAIAYNGIMVMGGVEQGCARWWAKSS